MEEKKQFQHFSQTKLQENTHTIRKDYMFDRTKVMMNVRTIFT